MIVHDSPICTISSLPACASAEVLTSTRAAAINQSDGRTITSRVQFSTTRPPKPSVQEREGAASRARAAPGEGKGPRASDYLDPRRLSLGFSSTTGSWGSRRECLGAREHRRGRSWRARGVSGSQGKRQREGDSAARAEVGTGGAGEEEEEAGGGGERSGSERLLLLWLRRSAG